jgi:hypothetical protein
MSFETKGHFAENPEPSRPFRPFSEQRGIFAERSNDDNPFPKETAPPDSKLVDFSEMGRYTDVRKASERKCRIGGKLTYWAESQVAEYKNRGIDVEHHDLLRVTPEEYRQMVAGRPWTYWGLPDSKDVPTLVQKYRSLPGTYASLPGTYGLNLNTSSLPWKYTDRPPEKHTEIDSKGELPWLREFAELAGETYLRTHGVPRGTAKLIVSALSYLAYGPKSTAEELTGLLIDKIVDP